MAIEDYMWELASAGNLQPLATGTVSDFHDTWDLVLNIATDAVTDYTPGAAGAISDEGYWDIDGSNIQPLDV